MDFFVQLFTNPVGFYNQHELLIAQISGARVPHDELLIEPELVVRGSTGPVPTAD